MASTKRFWIALSVMVVAAPAVAQSVWVPIGSRDVTDRVDRDSIDVAGHGQFDQVRLCTNGSAIRFHDVDVRFRNGASQDLAVRSLVPRGACTEAFDLRGRERDIQTVAFTYEAASLGRRNGRVRLYAR